MSRLGKKSALTCVLEALGAMGGQHSAVNLKPEHGILHSMADNVNVMQTEVGPKWASAKASQRSKKLFKNPERGVVALTLRRRAATVQEYTGMSGRRVAKVEKNIVVWCGAARRHIEDDRCAVCTEIASLAS